MARRTIRVRGTVRSTVRITRRIQIRPVVTYVEPMTFIGEAKPTMAEIAALTCSEHAQNPTITLDQNGRPSRPAATRSGSESRNSWPLERMADRVRPGAVGRSTTRLSVSRSPTRAVSRSGSATLRQRRSGGRRSIH